MYKGRPELFGLGEIDELLELGKTKLLKDIIDPIESGVDKLKKSFKELQILPGTDTFITRVDTFHIILNQLRTTTDRRIFEEILRTAGESVGISFARDFIVFLRDNKKLPENEEVLIHFWNKIDTNGGWGKFVTEFEKDKIIVKVKDSMLIRKLKENKHQFCSFMEGYIQGFIWEISKAYYRWFSMAVVRPAKPFLEPIKINEIQSEDSCTFTLELGEEKLVNAFDALETAKMLYLNQEFDKIAGYLRSSLEFAFKEKIGLDKTSQTSLVKILKAFKNNNIQLKYKTVDGIFAITSQALHGTRSLTQIESREMIDDVNLLLKSLELLELDNEKITTIKNEIV